MKWRGMAMLLPAIALVVGCSKAEDNKRAAKAAADDMSQHTPGGMASHSTGDADTDFLAGMIPHHQGALDMARDELAKGTDPKVREMAKEVIATQQAEIDRMQKWLAERQAAKAGAR